MLYCAPFAAKADAPSAAVTSRPLDIHLIAIGGTGMAPLACLLKNRGHRVRGSDGPLYPPMSTLLADAGITPNVGYDAAHLAPRPDLVIVGNAVPRTNPEAVEAERLGLPRRSMPEALGELFLEGREPLVVAGTHGKTTTSSLAAWVWHDCGKDPGYLIGGIPLNFSRSFHDGTGRRFVVEGDEYNAAYFDRGPKFLHYRPQALILTSVEYDHADLYTDPQSLLDAYGRLVEIVPASGVIAACGDSREVREVARRARCRVIFYGLAGDNEVHPVGPVETDAKGCRFRLAEDLPGDAWGAEEIDIRLPMAGDHNVANALAVWTIARHDGLDPAPVAAALARFGGVKRRMEELGTRSGVTVVDDFAHHPTAVRETIKALRSRYAGRRLVVAFEPRTLTAGRRFLHDAYRTALAGADVVALAPVFHAGRLGSDERLDLPALAAELEEAGVRVLLPETAEDTLPTLVRETRRGDVLATMSSGDFSGLPRRLLAALEEGGPSH